MKLPVYCTGAGEPLLMIHGIISDGSFFQNAAEYLKDQFYTIFYDRRGYGMHASEEKIRDFSVSAQAEDAAQILRDWADGPAWIFGNSAGGLIALELAQKYPDLVRGLLLLEPSLCYEESSAGALREWNRELNGYVQEKRIKKALPAFTRVVGAKDDKAEKTSLEELRRTYRNLSVFMYGELNEVQNYKPPEEKLKSLRAPVTVIITEDGKNSVFAVSSIESARILEWPVAYIPGYHNAVRDCPQEAAKRIKEIIWEMTVCDETKCTV